MMDKMTMRALRQIAGLTQVEAAEKLSVSATTLIKWEQGKTYPSAKKLAQMAELYGCTMSDFLIV